MKNISAINRNKKSNNDVFSKSLLDEIDVKAGLFTQIGFVDADLGDSETGKIVALKTTDLQAANEILQGIDLEEIRWYINMGSVSANTLGFARYLEHIYQSADFDPASHIEYVAYYEHESIRSKKEDGFLVTTFSRTFEKYFRKSALSGHHAISLYFFLLTLAKRYPGQLSEKLSVNFNVDAFYGTIDKKSTDSVPDQKTKEDENQVYVQHEFLQLQQLPHIKIVINVLWEQLRDDDKSYLKNKYRQGLSEVDFFALLLNMTHTRFSALGIDTPTFVDQKKIDLIVESTLPDETRDKKALPLMFLQEEKWGEIPLHSIFKHKIDLLLNNNPRWTQWLYEKLDLPLRTTQDWQLFLASAMAVHQSSRAHFIQVSRYSVIGPEEHRNYFDKLVAAQHIVTSSYQASIDFYLMIYPAKSAALQCLYQPQLTAFIDLNLSCEAQANVIYTFLNNVAVAYNRLERVDIVIDEDVLGPDFESRYLDKQQSVIISRHLKYLTLMVTKLANSESYLSALVDAYHELQYKGHNPSISVHNVLMDNKYNIYHRDVNFVRVARRSAKQIDMIIEEHGEVVRDKIVEEIKDYLRLAYKRLKNPNWVEKNEEPVEALTFKVINIQRIDKLFERLNEQKDLSERERRAQIHLQCVLRSMRRDLVDLPETNEMFKRNFHITIWDEALGDPKIIFPGLEILLPKIVSKNELEIEMIDPFDVTRDPTQGGHLSLVYKPPYCEISLHQDQYPIVAKKFIDHYGMFIFKVTTEVITSIEKDAEQFRSVSDQIILLAGELSGALIGASNDKIKHFTTKSPDSINYFIKNSVQELMDIYLLDHEDISEELKEKIVSNLRKKWLSERKWIVEINQGTNTNCVETKLGEYLEGLYEQEGFPPQDFIVYVGFPDMSLLKAKAQQGFLIRSGSNTNSVHYWPEIGFPDIIYDLPITYFNLLSFALHYPKKLLSLLKLIRETGDFELEGLKQIPTNIIITKDIVKQALQEHLEKNNAVISDSLYDRISEIINPNKKRVSLTEKQKNVVDSYVNLFDTLKSITIMKDNLINWPQQLKREKENNRLL